MLMQNGSILFAMFLCAHMLVAQCSDAGVCSLRDRTRKTEVLTLKHSIGISYIFGCSTNIDDITYHTAKIDGSFSVMETGSIMLAIPFNAQSGLLGRVLGIGYIICGITL